MEKLRLRQQKWIERDSVLKERKNTLKDVIELSMRLTTKKLKQSMQTYFSTLSSLGDLEKALFVIDDVFVRNRERSVLFMEEVKQLIENKRELLGDLGLTQIQLASKTQFIEEEKVDMRKRRQEMVTLGAMKTQQQELSQNI
jgi:hypothetical protein